METIDSINYHNSIDVATGFIRPKTTALFFDKLLAPKSIQQTHYGHAFGMFGMPESIELTERDVDDSQLFRVLMDSMAKEATNASLVDSRCECFRGFSQWVRSSARNKAIDYCASTFRSALGIKMVPIHVNKTLYEIEKEKEFQKLVDYKRYCSSNGINYFESRKSADVLEVTINSIPIAIEEELTWQQVLDFREDKTEIEKLRRFRRWAENNLRNKTTTQIQDELAQQLEDYEYALKKHGVQTTISGITAIVSASLLALSALEETNAMLGCIECGSASVSIIANMTNMIFSFKDIERMPIAYVYDVINEPEKWWGKKVKY